MDDFLLQMAAKCPSNDEIVKATIAALIDGGTGVEHSGEFYPKGCLLSLEAWM